MDRWNALELLILGVVLFAYFIPVASIPPPSDCVFGCPAEPQYGSLTYVYLGHGATLVAGIYSVRL
jgi:hypothetical protein